MPIDETGREYDESWDDAPTVSNLDGTTATIVRGAFELDEHYKDKDTDEMIPVFVAHVQIDGDDDMIRVLYSIGKGWEIADNGAQVVRTDNKPPKFSPSCLYKHLLNAALALNPELKYRSGPRFANLLDGTKWEWQDKEIKMGNNFGSSTRALPVKFLGFVDGKGHSTPAPKTPPKSSGNADILKKLENYAAASDTHQEFVDLFTGDEELSAALKADKALLRQCLNSGDKGFWSEHRQ